MSLYRQLQARQEEQRPIRVGVIGAGKFGTMFLAQAARLPGVHIVGIADLSVEHAKSNLSLAGWPVDRYSSVTLDAAVKSGATHVGESSQALLECPSVEIIVECTGDPVVAIDHHLAAFAAGKHVISATVEADAVCGAVLAKRAQAAGVIYSMAYGDQPAMVCELVDWARTCGFDVAAAGRGHIWRPEYRHSTPDTVWQHWGLTQEQAERGRLNPKMFNSFLDGTKPAIEFAAIANVCGLDVAADGLRYPSGSIADLPSLMRPRRDGGVLDKLGKWNFYKYAHESSYGITTVVKEGTNVGKVTIFARSVLADFNKSGNYWDKGTVISHDKQTGKFTASFKSFRHTPPGTKFDVYVNGEKAGNYNVAANGFWLSLGGRYMNPLWIIIGAILVGTYFSMIGAAGGMLMAAFQVIVVQTAGPVGINAANVLRPSNMALTLFSPLGSFYRYAVKERRVAWPVGISFGVGIFLGSIWLGKYATQYLPMKTYKEWLAILVVIMGIRTLYELSPKVMAKRKNIKAMVKKFNDAVAKAKAEGTSVEMGRIEPVQSGITDYRFKFWGEEFKINPLLFGLLGLGIGIVSRSFGIGGGFLLVPAMTTLGALPMYVAVPISLIGTSFSSVGAFIGYLMNGYLPDLWLMISIIIGGFAGGMLGSRAQKLFSERTLKIVLAITLFFLFFRFFKIEIWI